MEEAAQHSDISFEVIGRVSTDFWRKVEGGSEWRVCEEVFRVELLWDAEVAQLDYSCLCHEDILWLDIPMDNILLVNILDR